MKLFVILPSSSLIPGMHSSKQAANTEISLEETQEVTENKINIQKITNSQHQVKQYTENEK